MSTSSSRTFIYKCRFDDGNETTKETRTRVGTGHTKIANNGLEGMEVASHRSRIPKYSQPLLLLWLTTFPLSVPILPAMGLSPTAMAGASRCRSGRCAGGCGDGCSAPDVTVRYFGVDTCHGVAVVTTAMERVEGHGSVEGQVVAHCTKVRSERAILTRGRPYAIAVHISQGFHE